MAGPPIASSYHCSIKALSVGRLFLISSRYSSCFLINSSVLAISLSI
nr:MAG TPA: hypothetical protein [Caudoviricetes sp.]